MKEFSFIKDRDSQAGFIAVSIFIFCLGFFEIVFSSIKSIHLITNFSSFVFFLSDEICVAGLVLLTLRYGVRLGLSRRFKVILDENGFRLYRTRSESNFKEVRYSDIHSIWFISEKNLYGISGNILIFQKGFKETMLLTDFGGKKEKFLEMIDEITKHSKIEKKEKPHFGSLLIFLVLVFWK